VNPGEGIRRIAVTIRALGWLGAGVTVSGFWWFAIENREGMGIVLFGFGMGAAILAASYALAWIIDGFAAPRQ